MLAPEAPASADESKDRRRRLRGPSQIVKGLVGAILLYSLWSLTSPDKPNANPSLNPAEKSDPIRPPAAPLDGNKGNTDPDVFSPGSLNMTRQESLSKCYVDPKGTYKSHFGDGLCVVSKTRDFVFYHVRKSGSSTGREVATQQFAGKDMQRCHGQYDHFYQVAFVRNPITRFFAQYEEMFVRTLAGKGPKVPEKFNVFHNDLPDYKSYERIFCGKDADVPRTRQLKPCDQVLSREKGELSSRFEKFVEVWDGHVFEAHLAMQAPILSKRQTGRCHKLDFIGDTKHTKEHWEQIGQHLGVQNVKVIRGRAYPRRMNISFISTKTYERICRLAAIDFCCLNFPLPPQCEHAGVSCRWKNIGGEKSIVPNLADYPL